MGVFNKIFSFYNVRDDVKVFPSHPVHGFRTSSFLLTLPHSGSLSGTPGLFDTSECEGLL